MFRTYRIPTVVTGMALVGTAWLIQAANMSDPREVDRHQTFVATASTSNSANPDCNGKNNPSCAGAGPVKDFGVSLQAMQLMYPGITRSLRVRFDNPQSFPIVVTRLDVQTTAKTSGCALSDLATNPAGIQTVAIVVPAKSAATTSDTTDLRFALPADANPHCQSAIFNVKVTATAVKQ